MLSDASRFHASLEKSARSVCSMYCMNSPKRGPAEFYQYNEFGILPMPLDMTITPLYRAGGQDQPSLPGLMAAVPPRQVARGRDQDRLIVHLQIGGNAGVSSGQVVQAASRAALAFYASPGTITSSLRAAAQAINDQLHERNRLSPSQGMYAVGYLTLAVLRDTELTLLLSGPVQAFILRTDGTRRIADSLSGRGLGLGTTTAHYFAKVPLQPGDRILLCSTLPGGWEAALRNTSPTDLDATRRRLMNAADGDVNAVLLQAGEGDGALHLVRPAVAASRRAPTEPPSPIRQEEVDRGPKPGRLPTQSRRYDPWKRRLNRSTLGRLFCRFSSPLLLASRPISHRRSHCCLPRGKGRPPAGSLEPCAGSAPFPIVLAPRSVPSFRACCPHSNPTPGRLDLLR